MPPIPDRCDNYGCRFHSKPLEWNGNPLPLILEHINGVNTDNRAKNLRFLCPNCDSLNATTRGGANARKVIKSEGGFAIIGKGGLKHYMLPAEPSQFKLVGGPSSLIKSSPEY